MRKEFLYHDVFMNEVIPPGARVQADTVLTKYGTGIGIQRFKELFGSGGIV